MKFKKQILFLLIFILFSLYFFIGILNPKDNRNPIEKVFQIERGEGLKDISNSLKEEGLIRNRIIFNSYAFLTGNHKKIQSGYYLISSSENILKIIKKITRGNVMVEKITIPEGFNLNQIEERLNKSNLKRNYSFSDINMNDMKKKFDFLQSESLEGFLYPDTYYFNYNSRVEDIAERMLNNFDKKVYQKYPQENIFEIVTMASLIEKEVITSEDKKKVSGILWRRKEIGMPLQVDATIAYITGKRTTRISIEETRIDSPYNTYKYLGLPVGPICNPGSESILAALYPQENNYWYYLSTPEGETKFSKNLLQHNIYKNKYLR